MYSRTGKLSLIITIILFVKRIPLCVCVCVCACAVPNRYLDDALECNIEIIRNCCNQVTGMTTKE